MYLQFFECVRSKAYWISDMTWECKYQICGYCQKRKADCLPAEKGCVLYGKFVFVQDEIEKDSEFKGPEEIQSMNHHQKK